MDDTLPFKLVSDLCKWRTTTDHCNKLTDKPEKCHRRVCPAIKEARTVYQGPGVGMPAALLLDEFGSQVWSAFGSPGLDHTALHGVRVWTEVHCEMIHIPTGISVQEKDKSFPEVKKIMFNKLKKKLKKELV